MFLLGRFKLLSIYHHFIRSSWKANETCELIYSFICWNSFCFNKCLIFYFLFYPFQFNRNGYMHDYPTELRSKYVVSRELGTGACGTVRLGFHVDIHNHRYPVAIKIISKKMILSQNGNSDVAMNEVKILRAVDHPSVIRMEDVVETESHLYIILELAVGGELFEKIIQVWNISVLNFFLVNIYSSEPCSNT